MNVPKVSTNAVFVGSIMPPHRASAAKGEMFANAAAVDEPKQAGTVRTATNRTKTNKINKIPLNDPYRQYLNYYLGWGNYAKKVYKSDKKAIILAKSVKKQSNIYKSQLRECKKNLDRNKYIIF